MGFLTPNRRREQGFFPDVLGSCFNDLSLSNFWGLPLTAESYAPKIDILDQGQEYLVKADLPGWDKDDLELKITEDRMILKGSHKELVEEDNKDYLHKERRFSSFQREIAFREGVLADQAKASLAKGLLEIRIPKSEVKKKKTIPIEID